MDLHEKWRNLIASLDDKSPQIKIVVGVVGLIGAGIAAIGCLGAGIGIGIATGKASDAVARQPEASSKIMTLLILGGALAEATAIYGMIVALLIIFA